MYDGRIFGFDYYVDDAAPQVSDRVLFARKDVLCLESKVNFLF